MSTRSVQRYVLQIADKFNEVYACPIRYVFEGQSRWTTTTMKKAFSWQDLQQVAVLAFSRARGDSRICSGDVQIS